MKKQRPFLKLLPACMFISGCRNEVVNLEGEIIAPVVIALILIIFFVLAIYSNILRDEVSNCDEFEENALKLKQWRGLKVNKANPFSLTRVQFGLWTVVIASSYIYLALVKGDCSEGTINKTALVLMGIFSATVAGSVIIDKQEMNDNRPRHQNTPSQGFFIDILSDDNGISLHRFQNLIWTLIAMTIYLYKVSLVNAGCLLPELSNTLLGLTGISNATYLILRSQENAPPVQAVQNGRSGSASTPQTTIQTTSSFDAFSSKAADEAATNFSKNTPSGGTPVPPASGTTTVVVNPMAANSTGPVESDNAQVIAVPARYPDFYG